MEPRWPSRRTSLALAAAGLAVCGLLPIRWLVGDEDERTARALLATVLPDELLGEDVVGGCLEWLRGSRWADAYREDLVGLDVVARERFGRPFAECDPDERTRLVTEVLDAASPQSIDLDIKAKTDWAQLNGRSMEEPRFPNVALAVLMAVFSSPAAHDVVHGRRVGRMTCRGLEGQEAPPVPL